MKGASPAPTQAASPQQASPTPRSQAPAPLALTVSGGVSLGSYEAGFLYYLIEWLKRNPERARLRVATGASAGSTNALYALLESCSETLDDPKRSLFWTWVNLGFDDIFKQEKTRALGMFSAEGAQAAFDAIERRWSLGLSPACDVLYGATVTRLQPGEVQTPDGNLRLPSLEERFMMRVRGQGFSKPPTLEDYPATTHGATHLRLAVEPEGEAKTLTQLLKASSAFPIAFPPSPLRFCRSESGQAQSCTPEDATEALFVDGGVFDNTPVSLALQMMERGLTLGDDGDYVISDTPSRNTPDVPNASRFIVVAPGLASDARRQRKNGGPPSSVVPMTLQFFQQFISTARSRELAKLLESVPTLSHQVMVAPESLPPMSGHMYAFFGFFERKLRLFDFALGMHEARSFLERHAVEDFANGAAPTHWVENEEPGPLEPQIYREYRCIKQTLNPEVEDAPACQHPSLIDFRILLQVSIEVLHQRCLRDGVRGGSVTCDQVRHGDDPVRVLGLEPRPGCERGENEGETSYVIRRLSEYGFEFTDLGLERDEANLAHARIRDELEKLVRALAAAQRGEGMGQAIVVRTTGRVGANLIEYRPPDYTVHFAIGSPWELGGTGLIPVRRFRGFRWVTALQLWGMETLVSSQSRLFGFAPVAGFELEPVRYSGPFVQLRFGGVAGYTFVYDSAREEGDCSGNGSLAADEVCSRPLTQAYLVLTILEVVRLGLNATVLPKMRRRGDGRLHIIRPNVGVQLPF